jgi:hypothetical protein
MIDYTTIRKDVETYLTENFSECVVVFENLPLPVDNPDELIEIFDETDYSQKSYLGADSQLIEGMISISIKTQRNSGTQRNREIAVILSALLADKVIGCVQFKDAEYKSVVQDTLSVYFLRYLHIGYVVDYGGLQSDCVDFPENDPAEP